MNRDVSIGDNTQIGSGTRIGSGVSIGQNVIIGQDVKIRPGVSIDDGATIPPNTTVDSDVSGTDDSVTPSEPTTPPTTSPAMPTVPGSSSPPTTSPAEPEPTATTTTEPAPTATETTTTTPPDTTAESPTTNTATATETASPATEQPTDTATETTTQSTETQTPTSTATTTVAQTTAPATTTTSTTEPTGTPTTAPSPTSTTPTTTASPTPTTTDTTTTSTPTTTTIPPTETTTPTTTTIPPTETTTPTTTTIPPTETTTPTTTTIPPTETTTPTTTTIPPTETTTPTTTTTPPTETTTPTTTTTPPTETTTPTTTTTPPTETTTPEPPGSPNIALSPAASDYGDTLIGTNGTQTFTITNDGDADLSVDGISVTGSNTDQFEITDGGGSFVLAPGDSRLVTVKFLPTATGQQTATLEVASDDPDSPTVSSTLTGTGVQPAIELTPTEYDYGSVPVDSGDTQTFTVTNNGTAPLSVTATRIAGTDADQFEITDGGGQFTLAPGESREIRVRFGPASAGTKNAVLEVVSEAADGGVLSAALSGTGTQSNIVVEPPSLAYGDVSNGNTSTQTFTVTNDGDAPLNVTGTAIDGVAAGEFAITDGGGSFTLGPGESREITVEFAPTSTGAKNASVVVESDDADQPTVTVPLAGTGVAPGITLTPTEHDYGSVATGSTNVTTFTVTNDGTAPLSVSETTITGPNAGEFAITDGGGAFALAPGESKEIRVRFAPDSPGAKSVTLAVENNAGETLTAALSGTGAQSNIVVDPPSHDYGDLPNNRNATQTFTITNDGDAPLSVSNVTIAGVDPGSFTILSGDGAFDLAPGESREVTVRFAPTSPGEKAGQLVVASDDSDQPTLTVSLTGTSTEPDITLTPDARDYGDVPVDSAETRTFVVRNDGSALLSVSDVTIAGTDADQFTVTDGGGSFELAPDETRTITVAFSPTSPGAKNATLEVASDDADSPTVTGSLTGQGTQSNIVVDPASLDYGDVANNGQATQTFTVTNDGDAPLTVSETTLSGPDTEAFTITDGNGSFTLAPGESRNVTVTFAPGSTGDKTAEVVIASDDADQPTVTVPLSGGSVEPDAVLTPSTYDYGDVPVDSVETQTFVVRNDGNAPLSVSGTSMTGPNADEFAITDGGGAFTLAPGESRAVTVTFTPTSTGAKNATLEVASDDPDSPTLTSSLSGTSTQSNIVVDPTSLDYGAVPNNGQATQTVTITNDGDAPLSVSDTRLTGANADDFTITDGGGAFTLAPGESREVTVTFAPNATGDKTANLVVESDDADQPTVTVPLSGGSVEPSLTLSPVTHDYGDVPVGSANTTTFTVTNDGTAPLDVSATRLSGVDAAEFAVISGGGSFTLAPGESREVTVEFASGSTGTKSATLEVDSNDPNRPTVTSSLTGQGTRSNIVVDPTSIDYGNVSNNSTATQTVTVTNDGDAPLSVSGTSISGLDAGDFTITDGGGAFDLAPGESREVTVAFAPDSTGDKTAAVVIESDDADQPTVTVPLSGESVEPDAVLTPSTYDYGDVPVGSGDTKVFTVTNDGSAPLSVSETRLIGADSDQYSFVSGDGAFTLAPGESREITVSFAPTSTGTKNATLEIASDDPDSPTLTSSLSGTGTQSNIVVDPPSLDYGEVPNNGEGTRTLLVTNDGTAPLSVNGTTLSGADAGEFTITDGSGPFTLAPGESREITIQFAPTSVGERNAQLVVESDDADQPTVTVPLSGESVAPNVVLSPPSHDFGEVPTGSANTTTFTVTNDGSAPLSVNGTTISGANAGEFAIIDGGGTFTLGPGESREVTVEFAPNSTGAKTATLDVESNDSDQPIVSASLAGTGIESNIVVNPDTYDYGEVANNSTTTQTFTVSNDGTSPLTVSGTSLVGSDASEFAITDGGGAFTLAPGESRNVTVQFAPTSAGNKTANLVVESDDPDQPTVTVPLSGESVEPNVNLSPPSHDYGDVPTGSANTTTFTVTNDGTAPLDVSATNIVGADAGEFTITDGGGAFTLAPGESREITVEFAPGSTGEKSATLEVESNDPDQPAVSSNLSGTGVESNIVVDPESNDYGQVANNGNSTQTFTVTNDGTAPLSVSGTSIAGDNASEFTITDGGGAFTLAPGESREVTVEFAPTSTGNKTANLVVESDDSDQPTLTVPLSGESVEPNINLTPTEYDYGGVPINTGNVTTFTVTNDGTAPLTVSGTTISGTNASEFALVDGGRSYLLAPGESRDIRVRFMPNSTGAKSATIELASDDPDQPTVTANLTGTGTASNIVVDPPSYDYRQVPAGSNQTQTFTITNDGDAPLSVSSTSIVGANASDFTITDGGGPFVLQPGESQSVEVRIDFAPTSVGEKKATFIVESDDPDQPTVTVPISGTSIAPSISLTPETRDLGEVSAGSTNQTTFTITNDGTAGLNVSALNIVGANASEFTIVGPDAPFKIEPGQSREVTVEFSPGSAGAKNATLEVQSDDPNQPTVTANLTGTGTASNLVVDPARYDFGQVANGTTNTTTFTVTNDGTAPLVVTDTSIVGANGEEFSIVDGAGPFTLAPGEVREITVGFSPTSDGPKEASLVVESDAVNQQDVTVPLSGSGFTPRCNVQVSDVTAPDTVTQGEQATITANVTNVGQANDCGANATLDATGQTTGKVDIVFLLDDSGSMQPYIDQVRDDIRGFNSELESQGIDARFAVVTYGKGSAVLRQDYSSNVAQTERTIDGISASGAFEANYRAIRGSLNALSPRSDAKNVLIDITNEDSDRLSTDPTQDELVSLIDSNNAKLISVSPDVDYIRNYNNLRGEAYDPTLDLRVLAERVADGAWFDLFGSGNFVDKFTNEVITSVDQNTTQQQSVTLDAGESQQVTFTIDTSTFQAGEIVYSVTVNASTRTGRITVE